MSFREAMPAPNHPPGALPLNPAGGLPFPRPPVPPTSKYWLRHCFNQLQMCNVVFICSEIRIHVQYRMGNKVSCCTVIDILKARQ